MQISLSIEKLNKIKQEAKALLSKSETSVQRLAAFVGMTVAAKKGNSDEPTLPSILASSDEQSVTNGKITRRSQAVL